MQGLIYCAEARMEQESTRIARGLRDRDPDVLDGLIEQYQHRLYRYLVFFTRDRQLAEDLFQETWIRVLEKGSTFDSRYRFEAWLLRVARNLAIDELRRRMPAGLASIDTADDALFDVPRADDVRSAFDLLAAREMREKLDQIMDRMPPYYREVLTLRFHEDMSLEEIALVVDAPLSTVKSRLRRGLQMLSTRLEGNPL